MSYYIYSELTVSHCPAVFISDFHLMGNRNSPERRPHRTLDICGGEGPRHEAQDSGDHRRRRGNKLHEKDGTPMGYRPEEIEVQRGGNKGCLA